MITINVEIVGFYRMKWYSIVNDKQIRQRHLFRLSISSLKKHRANHGLLLSYSLPILTVELMKRRVPDLAATFPDLALFAALYVLS